MECFDSFNDNHQKQFLKKSKYNTNLEIEQLQKNMIDYVLEEIHGANSEIMENFGIISSLENEVETKDLLIEKQNDVINDFTALLAFQKQNQQTFNLNSLREPPDGREKKTEKRRTLKCVSISDSDSWSQPDTSVSKGRIGIKLLNPSNKHDLGPISHELRCHDNCLYKEIADLSILIVKLLKQIQSCEIEGSDLELGVFGNEAEKKIEINALKYEENSLACHYCASSVSQDFWEMMQTVRSSLHSAQGQANRLIHDWREVNKRAIRAEEEEERTKDKLGEYHILIARLSDQNLRMTGERLDFNSRLEEAKGTRRKEVMELQDQLKYPPGHHEQIKQRKGQLTIRLNKGEQFSDNNKGKHSPTRRRETNSKDRSWGTDDEKEGRKLLYENRNFLGFHLPKPL